MTENNVMKVSLLAGLGGMLEFYDFILYILFSNQISTAFFDGVKSDYIKTLLTIAVFSVAYIVRPIGGFLIGWLGDNIGRKKSFSFTILLMATCMFFMGIMPTYIQIGISASIFFIILRVIQGLALGGELPGAIVFVYESVDKKGLALGVLFSMVFFGFIFGDIMSVIIHYLFAHNAWRVAFISGSLIAFIGYYIRQKLNETKMFSELKKKQKFPLSVIVAKHLRNQIASILSVIIVAFNGVIISLYLSNFIANHLHYSHIVYEPIIMASAVLNIIVIFLSSLLTDYIDYRKLYKISALAMLFFSYPCFMLITSGDPVSLLLGVIIITILPSIITGLFMKIICESFTTNIRFTGVALGYNIAFALVGGLAPISIELMIKYINITAGPAIVSIACAILGLLSLYLIKPIYNQS